jgi:superfamily II DNA/RNA helicase
MKQSSDLRFFTNTPDTNLENRFVSVLKDVKYFDVLVGYFRTSGFARLYKQLETVDKMRLLIGLDTDKKTFELYSDAIHNKKQQEIDFFTHERCRQDYKQALSSEIENTEESSDIEIAARKFIEFIENGKLELRVHPSQNIHAKLYIMRFGEDDRDLGRVITGSSNFSHNGLNAQREFNVELKDHSDVQYALEQFNVLWDEGVEISREYVDTIKYQTWLNDDITPYEIYLKFLYEYFKEEINLSKDYDFGIPHDFMQLDYQKDAVISAKKILETYNGVFLSDVVGLGKTFITSMLLKIIPQKRKLIICPPVLEDYWRDTLHDFHVTQFDIKSLGKLDKIIKDGTDKYGYIIIDEAHRFRNDNTKRFEQLKQICYGKKVILVSATPLNNKLNDIKSLITLFQASKNSNIPAIRDLDVFFNAQQKEIDTYDKGTPEKLTAIKRTSQIVRDKVLKHIMVRRTRSEIKKYFAKDIEKQGLFFPELADPQRLIYVFDNKTESVFNQTIEYLKIFSYSRYMPLLFLKIPLGGFEAQSQRNVGGFMKGILVKRLESSFYAFKKSLTRFITSHERFIQMFDTGTVYISNDIDVYDYLDNDNEDKLLKLVDEDKAKTYQSSEFDNGYKDMLVKDLQILHDIYNLWHDIDHDPKADSLIEQLKNNTILKNQKVILFSESKETIEYLYQICQENFKDQVISFSSQGGLYQNQPYNNDNLRTIIEENYQPKHKNPKDDIQILLTTDVLAEGINLHRSHIIINYDLPWNPTRILQRVGRVNRVGTKHEKIYVFNIFPTAQSDEHLGLEDNIKGKIQAFHNTLGEDAKYLSSDEEISNHELFGKKLYDTLNDKDTLNDSDDDEEVTLKYLTYLKNIQENNPELFNKIKKLPKKIRSSKQYANNADALVTFFRKGAIQEFILCKDTISLDIPFAQAAGYFECLPNTKKQKLDDSYYLLLDNNKKFIENIINAPLDMQFSKKGTKSHDKELMRSLKMVIDKYVGYTDTDNAFLKNVKQRLEDGVFPPTMIKKIISSIKDKDYAPLAILHTLKQEIPETMLAESVIHTHTNNLDKKSEVILSLYLKQN